MKLNNNEARSLEIKTMNEGHISFYASVFGVVDSDGDMTHKGTFVETKRKFEEGEISVDLRLEHKATFKTVGTITEMEIDDHGLKCKAVFTDSPIGRKVHKIAKDVFETKSQDILFSIGFVAIGESTEIIEGKSVRSLDNVLLGEVSIVEKPSNPEAKVLEVKNEVESEKTKELEKELKENYKAEDRLYQDKNDEAELLYIRNEEIRKELEIERIRTIILQELNA